MFRLRSIGWMTLVLFGWAGLSVFAEEDSAAELYGRGVHAYFAADYDQAVDWFTKSLAKSDLDPRAYYFRGLAMANKFGVEAGQDDFAKGADVEVNRTERPVYDINGALQRVQGSVRLELEKVRAATRQAAMERQKKRNRVRYEELKRRDDIVLFDPNRPAPEVKLDLPQPDLRGADNPFASGMAFSGGKQVAVAAPAAAEAAPAGADQPQDPFAGVGAAGKMPATEDDPFASPAGAADPFAAKPAASGRKPAAEKPPAEAEANPFGENLPKLDLPAEEETPAPGGRMGAGLLQILGKTLSGSANRDPFADSAPQPQPAADSPAPDPSQPAADPFDSGTAESTDEKKPADASDDPFDSGDAKGKAPAAKPAESSDDPFDSGDAKGNAPAKPADPNADPFK